MTTALSAPIARLSPLGRYRSLLVTYLRPQWPRALLLGALLLTSAGLQLAGPQILRYFIDAARAGAAVRTLALAGGLFLAFTLLEQAVWLAASFLSQQVGWTATNDLRADLTEHCLGLDMSFHNAHTPGELIERIDGDTTNLSNFFSQLAVLTLGSVLLLLGVLVLLYREDWRVGLGLTFFVLVAVIILHRVRHLAVPAFSGDRQASAEMYGFLEERLSGIPDIHASGAQPYVMRRFFEVMRARFLQGRRAFAMGNAVFIITSGLFTFGYVVAFAVGATLYRGGAITLGTVYLIFHYTQMLRWPLEQIVRQLQDFQRASASIGRIQALREVRSALRDGDGAALPQGPLAVEFRDVTFGYGADEPVLREVSFRLEAGRVLGVLGRTGSGKTTLTRILFRFYDPEGGAILLGGAALHRLRLADLQRAVGIVTQDVQLFHASVRDNLTLFDTGIPDGRILEVLEELGLAGWCRSLPSGLETELAAGGKGLSGGEAQLLALSRVFLRDPGLVVLDEASSRLDPATEQLIERAVGRLLRGRTGIVIAHRLATVQRADEILILEAGRVREHGARLALASEPGSRFCSLLQTGLQEVLA